LNPFQLAASGNITNMATYICDQTIALTGNSGNVGYAIDPITDGLQLTTAGSNDSFYLMQYLSENDAKKILGTQLSVNVNGYVTSSSGPVSCQVYLCRSPSTSTIPILPTSIGTLASNGAFTLTAPGWTFIPRSGLDTATSILPVVLTNDEINDLSNDIPFTGWQVTDSSQITDTQYFAIVVTFSYTSPSTALTVNSISLIPSSIPARPAPESFSEVLKKCQYYYETSYDIGLYAGAVSNDGTIACEQILTLGANALPNGSPAFPRFLSVRYTTSKRIPVIPSIYAPDGTIANVLVIGTYITTSLFSTDATILGNWTLVDNGCTGFSFKPVNLSVSIASGPGVGALPNAAWAESVAIFHYVSDARLGIV
jgi:hypothetical protein